MRGLLNAKYVLKHDKLPPLDFTQTIEELKRILPENVYNENMFKNVRITYKKEVKFGDIVNCYYTNKENKHIVTIKSEDNETVHAVVKLY